MSLISQSIANLINGVSQQPYTLRLASQAAEQINGLSSVVDGLNKRPPTKHVAKFRNTPVDGAYTHVISRDEQEKYIVVITNGDLHVYDLAGNEKVVNFPDGKAYLESASPESSFSTVTVADYTFVVNKNVQTDSLSNTFSPSRPNEGLIWVKQGAYSSTYKIMVDGETAEYATLDAGNAANAPSIQTSYICGQLHNIIQPLLAPKGIGCDIMGSSLYFACEDRDFSMATFDPLGDTALKLVKGAVQKFSDLPARARAGMVVRVAGSGDGTSDDDYWVKYEADPTNQFGGLWKETVKGREVFQINANTMPHILVRDADGSFSFEVAAWADRRVGDSESNPFPSFIKQRISDVLFHRNRLGFLSGENLVLSQAGEFFDFFRSSVMQTLDTDPIDIAVSHVKVSELKAAIPYNQSLLLFSEQSQFQLAKTDLLTPKTVGLNLATEFSADLYARPVGVGNNVYFAQSRGGYSGLREYYADPDTAQNDAVDVTSHCPTYIPGRIRKMAATSNENTIVCLSDTVRDTIYVYRYYWARQEKLQSSWSKWVLPAGSRILDCSFLNSTLVLIIARDDGCYIETLSLDAGITDGTSGYYVRLDRRVDPTTVALRLYYPETNTTNIQLPYPMRVGEEYVVVAWEGDATYKPGQVIPYTTFQGDTLIVPGNLTSYIIGVKYLFRYRFSPFVIREQAPGGSGMQAVSEGRLQIRKVSVAYSRTGYFRAEVTPIGRQTFSYVFARVLASLQSKLGESNLETATFHFPVVSKNDQVTIELVNDSHLPCAFLSAEWEGFYVLRSKRM